MAVSVDMPDKLQKAKDKIGAEFRFISDPQGKLLDPFGLRHVGGNPFTGTDIARPAHLLVSRQGVLLWSHFTGNYRARLTPNTILAASHAAMGE